MRSDSSLAQRFKVELIVLLCLVVLTIAVILHHFPLTLSSDDGVGTAMMPQQLGQSDILLILPDTNETASTYPQLDFSFAWYNLLSQYFGPFTITLAKEINNPSDVQFRLIVVPQRTAEQMDDAKIQLISQAVQAGSTLIVEMPPPEWSLLTAIKRRAKVSSSIKHFTDAPNTPLTGQWRDQLLNTPLDTQVMRLDALDSEALKSDGFLLELDGAIAHYRKNVGSGTVFVLAFNAGQVITSMMQGRPADDFTVPTENEVAKTADLVLNERLRTNSVPYADLLKTHIIASVLYSSPMPLLWPFPNGYRSALLLTHESASSDDRIFKLAEYEESREVKSTWLVTATRISKDILAKWRDKGFEIGVSFLRPPEGRVYRKYGPSFFQPVVRETNMADQRSNVASRLDSPVTACKNAASVWTNDASLGFRQLVSAQCQVDLSYAPVDEKQYGYLFGSGFPFLPIERNGLPMPLYEFPALINDETGLESLPADAALNLLRESESVYHEPVLVNFNADTMVTHPSYLSPSTWVALLNYALGNSVWVTTVQSFMHYYTVRKKAHIHYAFHPQTKVLDAQAGLPKAPFSYTIALPKRTQYGALHTVWLDKSQLDMNALKSTADGLLVLIPVENGDHLVQAQYQ